MILKYYAGILFVSSLFVVSSDGQTMNHMLKYLNSGSTPATTPIQFTSAPQSAPTNNIGNRMIKANRICVSGMWALYNNTNFGAGVDDSTTVISIRGTDINACTSQIPILQNVRSVAYLGNADYDADGIHIYSQPYLLGGYWDATMIANRMLPNYITGFTLGSVAITGTSAFILCADQTCEGNTVCVDMKYYGRLFLQRNPAADSSVTWPKVIRKVSITDSTDCLNHPTPARPTTRQRLLRREVTAEGIEISVYNS